METSNLSSLLSFAYEVEDFRTGNRLYYPCSSIIFMAFMGILCGGEDWEDIVEISESGENILREILGDDFVGVPSHDTFSRFFSLVNPLSLENAFRKTMSQCSMQKNAGSEEKEVIAIDGKYILGVTNESALNMVSAYATHIGLCLGQEIATKKMNEPEALRKLVRELNIKDSIITADALHCQKKSVKEIVQMGGDYLLMVKSNQKHLYEGILEGIRTEIIRDKKKWIDHARQTEEGHGRNETRICHSCSHPGWLPACGKEWEGIKSYGVITHERTVLATGETSSETRCFISSLEKDAPLQLTIMREHWKIENNLHWQLDVSFNEDDAKMNKNQSQNISLLRKLAMPVLKEFTYKKGTSMKKKMMAAAIKPDIRAKLIQFAILFYSKS